MRIQHNIMAMNAYRNLGMNNSKLSKNLEKLSSGYKINRAGDDAAGLAISEKMRSQIAGLDQAQKNAQSGINMVQTAEGALTEVHDMLNRMVTLTTQAANGTYSKTERDKIKSELDSLTNEIDRIATHSNFNGTKLLNGDLKSGEAGEAGEVTYELAVDTQNQDVISAIEGLEAVEGGGDVTVTTVISTDDNDITVTYNNKDYTAAGLADTSIAQDSEVTLTAGDGSTITVTLGAGIGTQATDTVVATTEVAGAEETPATGATYELTLDENQTFVSAIEGLDAVEGGGDVTITTVISTDDNDITVTYDNKDYTAAGLADTSIAADSEVTLTAGDGSTITVTLGAGIGTQATDAVIATTTEIEGEENEVNDPVAPLTGGMRMHIGSGKHEFIDVTIEDMGSEALGLDKIDITDSAKAEESLDVINAAIEKVSVQRSNLGAIQNRLEHTINNLGVMEENIQDAEANIRDTDIADEMMAYTKNNILIQSAQAMLAQANQVPQGVLQLMQ